MTLRLFNRSITAIVIGIACLISSCGLGPKFDEDDLIRSGRAGNFARIDRALRSDSHYDRLAGIKALLKIDSDLAFARLIAATKDQTVIVRTAVLNGARNMSEARCLLIVDAFLDDTDETIVEEAIALAQLRISKGFSYSRELTPAQKNGVVDSCRRNVHERLAELRASVASPK